MTTLDSQLINAFAPTVVSRNAFIDLMFYDVGALTEEEGELLSPWLDHEGTILWVPPGSSGEPIAHFPSTEEFLNEKWLDIQAVVVAGVGSSALGTAALARNVANACGFEVAGVVSGYGVSDLVSEAMGGWFIFGAADAVRHGWRESLAWWERMVHAASPAASRPAARAARALRQGTSDLQALVRILDSVPPNLTLLVGHSKGNLLVDYALERLARRVGSGHHPYFEDLRVVTLGAIVDFPNRFRKTRQFLGAYDWFGGLNSRLDLPHVRVPEAWHHLNTRLPFHLSVERVLEGCLEPG